ncbi:MAG: thiamine pyrophosphate-binding protein [Streptosporangiaceae bacterium]
MPALDWQVTIAETLVARGVTVAAYVPDTRLDGILTRLAELGARMRSLTREEECVGYAAGQRIAGARPVVLMQSSGLGNAINALGSLAVPYRLGIPLVISMRGTLGEANPSQVPMGRATLPLLQALGIQAFSLCSAPAAGPVTEGVLTLAYEAGECAALLLEPQLGGGRAGN